jgi:diadenosine tetraphosphate (Ap4A) HIT family hydrolase
MTECETCARLARRDAGDAPAWEAIFRTPSWDVVHAYNSALPGWLVLVTRRHITTLAEMSDAEASELGPLTRSVSAALHDVVRCTKTYIAQFAEDPLHPHVHVHVIPRNAVQPKDQRGPRVFSLLGVSEELRVPEARMNEIAVQLRVLLGSTDPAE